MVANLVNVYPYMYKKCTMREARAAPLGKGARELFIASGGFRQKKAPTSGAFNSTRRYLRKSKMLQDQQNMCLLS